MKTHLAEPGGRRWPGDGLVTLLLAVMTAAAPSCHRAPPSPDGDDGPTATQTGAPHDPLAEAIAALAATDANERLGATQAVAAYGEQHVKLADLRRRYPQAGGGAAADRGHAQLVAALPRLAALTADAVPAVRGEAIVALGTLGEAAAPEVERIRVFMRDPANPPGYRQYGPVALGRVLGAAAVAELEQMVAAAPPGDLMTTAAFFALGEIGVAATDVLGRLSVSRDAATRRAAFETVARLGVGAVATLPVLSHAAASDADDDVRTAAVRAILKVEPTLATSAPLLAAAAADPRLPRHVCYEIGMALTRRPGIAATFDERRCATLPGRPSDADALAVATAKKQRALASVLAGGTVTGILADLPIGGDHETAAERLLVACTPAPAVDLQSLLARGGTVPAGPAPLVLVAVRMAADGRVLDHRIGTLDAEVRAASCGDGRADAFSDPTRWPVLSFTYRAAYGRDGQPAVVHWAGQVLLEQMAWLSRVPTLFGRVGGYVEEIQSGSVAPMKLTLVGASSGVVQDLAAWPATLNARFAPSVGGSDLAHRRLVVPTVAVLRGPLSEMSLEARPWEGAPAPLPSFIVGGFQAGLDPAVATTVSSLPFWRAQLAHPHMLIRLHAVQKLIDTGFEDEAIAPFIQVLSVPSRYADLALGLGDKFGPALVPALSRVVHAGHPVAAPRALGLLARRADGGTAIYEALALDTVRGAALQALQGRPTPPDEAQIAQLARVLPQVCKPLGQGCWQAQAVLSRAGAKAAAAAPAVREVLAAAPTPYFRVLAARTLDALGDRDTAWKALAAEADQQSDDALAALHGIDKARSRPRLLAALLSDNDRMADAALRLLAAEPPRDDVTAAAATLFEDSRPERRIRAVGLLAPVRTAAGDALVVRAFRDVDRRVRAVATPLVVARGGSMLAEMRRALGDASFAQRAEMARGIGQLGPSAAVALPDLVRALDTDDSGLRTAAHQAILAVGRERMPTAELVRLAGASGVLPPARRRLEVLQVLRRGGAVDASALAFLRSMLPGQDRQVQLDVIETLARVGPAAFPLLRQLDAPSSPADVRAAARRTLTTITTGAQR